jgi:hypothetical protein
MLCHYAECRYAECRGATSKYKTTLKNIVGVKRCSVSRSSVNDEEKQVYNISDSSTNNWPILRLKIPRLCLEVKVPYRPSGLYYKHFMIVRWLQARPRFVACTINMVTIVTDQIWSHQ